MENKIIYQDISPGAAEDGRYSAADTQSFAKVSDLLLRNSPPNVATLELNRWGLDGKSDIMPQNPSSEKWGYWSRTMSGVNGYFPSPLVLEVNFGSNHTSVGITLDFDVAAGDYCSELNIKWYRGTQLLASRDFAPNRARYECVAEVELYNKVVITFKKMCLPYRYMRLQGIIFGIERTFGSDEISDDSLEIVEEINPLGAEISINTLDFGLRSSGGAPFIFQKKQPLVVYHGEETLGVFFIDKAKRTSESNYQIGAIDAVGVLDESEFLGGIYVGETAQAVATQIIGDTFALEIAPALASIPVHGFIPICTKREALGQLGFALGAIVDTHRSDKICVNPQGTAHSTFGSDRIFEGLEVETDALVTGVQIVAHKYEAAAAEAAENIFSGTVSGQTLIKFSEPMHTLAVTGGAIIKSGANFATISGNGTVSLSGKKYRHTTQSFEISNPLLTTMDKSNVKKVDNATLITAANANAAAQRVYNYYLRRDTATANVILAAEKVGDTAGFTTPFSGEIEGVISRLEMSVGNKLTARVVAR